MDDSLDLSEMRQALAALEDMIPRMPRGYEKTCAIQAADKIRQTIAYNLHSLANIFTNYHQEA